MSNSDDFTFNLAEDPELSRNDDFSNGQRRVTVGGEQQDASELAASEVLEDMAYRQNLRSELASSAVTLMQVAKDGSKSFAEKQNALTNMLVTIMPAILREITAQNPNPDRSLVISRTTSLLKEIGNIFASTEKTKTESTVNPHSPRFRDAIKIFFNEVQGSIGDAGVPKEMQEAFYNALSDRLRGWEERIEALNTLSETARSVKVPDRGLAKAIVDGDTPDRVRMN